MARTQAFLDNFKWAVFKPGETGIWTAVGTLDKAFVIALEKGPEYRFTLFDDWLKLAQKAYLDKPIEEISEEKFYEMLECLPPRRWKLTNPLERFNMSEFTDGDITAQYVRFNGKFYFLYVADHDNATYFENRKDSPYNA